MIFCIPALSKTELTAFSAVFVNPSPSPESGRILIFGLVPRSFALLVSITGAMWLKTSLCCQKNVFSLVRRSFSGVIRQY